MFLYDPDRVEELAQKFINDWCSKNGKVVRFYTNRIKWKSEIPELAPFIKKVFQFINRWRLGEIDFDENLSNPDIVISQGKMRELKWR